MEAFNQQLLLYVQYSKHWFMYMCAPARDYDRPIAVRQLSDLQKWSTFWESPKTEMFKMQKQALKQRVARKAWIGKPASGIRIPEN